MKAYRLRWNVPRWAILALIILMVLPAFHLPARVSAQNSACANQPPLAQIQIEVSGASLAGYDYSRCYYSYITKPNSVVTISASSSANPQPLNDSGSGVLAITFTDPFTLNDKTTSTNGTGEALSLSASTSGFANATSYNAEVDFSTNCGYLRGCVSGWTGESAGLLFYVQPSITLLHDNSSGEVNSPNDILFYGSILPASYDEQASVSVTHDGIPVTTDRIGLNASLSYNFQYNFFFADSSQNGAWQFIFNATTDHTIDTGNDLTTLQTVEVNVNIGGGNTNSTSSSETNTSLGNQVFTGSLKDSLGRSIRGAEVQLFWSSQGETDPILFTPLSDVFFTDYLGGYSISGNEINSSMPGWGYLQVTLKTDNFVVKDNTTSSENPYALPAASFAYPNALLKVSSVADLHLDIAMTDSQTPSWASSDPTLGNYSHAGGLGVIYVNTFNSMDFYSNVLNLHRFRPGLPVVGYASETFFKPSGSAPFIAIDKDDSSRADNIANREYHEFAHYMMFLYFGGSSYFQRPGTNHGGFANLNSKDSWTEAWAEFWGQISYNYAINNTSYNAWYQISPSSGWNLRWVEPINRTVVVNNQVYYKYGSEELGIAQILWAIYAPNDLIDGAATQESPQNVVGHSHIFLQSLPGLHEILPHMPGLEQAD